MVASPNNAEMESGLKRTRGLRRIDIPSDLIDGPLV